MATPGPPSGAATVAAGAWRIVRALLHPVVLIFDTAALFSYLSGDTVRAAYFLLVGVALATDRATRRREAGSVPRARQRPPTAGFAAETAGYRRTATHRLLAVTVAVGAAYALVVGTFQRYSIPATVFVTALCAVAILAAWRTSATSETEPLRLDPAGVAAWVFIALGMSALELTSLYLQPTLMTDSYAHPTLSYLANTLLASWPGRSAVIFAWLAFGWFLARL